MSLPHIVLLVINIAGGAAVLLSYYFGLNVQAGGTNALWGGVPVNIRPLYGVSMIISALGYLAFIYYLLFRVDPATVTVGQSLGYGVFYTIFIFILVPSALWMPLSNLYVSSPGSLVWLSVRIVLALVGLAAIALVWALLALQPRESGVFFWLAVGGAGYFAFHTAVLDAIIWAALFK